MLSCEICGKKCRVINFLHLRTHNETVESYKEKFPHAILYDEETKSKMKNSANEWHLTNKRKPRTIEQNKAHALKMTGKKFGNRSEETKARMREAWENNRQSWSESIKKSANTPEMKEKFSQAQKKRIERDGYHLARGKETSLEKFVRECIEDLGYTAVLQKGTLKNTLGIVRFFDVYVPELNLIIEADGEWWHRTEDRIQIDKDKTLAAIKEGYAFLRISDRRFNKKNRTFEDLKSLIFLSPQEQLEISNEIINEREVKVRQGL